MRRFWRSNNRNAKPQLPYGTRVYAIGGRADLLSEMLDVIDADLARSMPPDPIEVFLGDYVDRGPDSSKTLDLLIQRGRTRKTVFLRGNHEAYTRPICLRCFTTLPRSRTGGSSAASRP
jgi:serine/threonine protein phosphatase 1